MADECRVDEHGECRAQSSITLTELRVLRKQIAALTAQVKKLVSRVGGWEKRQEEAAEAAQKALEMIEEMGEENASADKVSHGRWEKRDTRGGTDTDTDTDTDTPCDGVLVGGYCWYLGALDLPCGSDTVASVCGTHGGYNEATDTFAGYNGTYEGCEDVLDALGAPAGVLIANESAAAVGCTYLFYEGPTTTTEYRHWCHITPTQETTGTSNSQRACACNE